VGLTGDRQFVGFGFGPIQAGLFLYEAYRSGKFRRLTVAEVMPEAVRALRQSGGMCAVNVAGRDGVEAAEIGPVEIANPAVDGAREFLEASVAEASEMATTLPSVTFYASDSPGSVHRILANGLMRKAAAGGPPAVIYAAENHNQAAEILEAHVMREVPEHRRAAVRRLIVFLNTVIGKMSGVVGDALEIRRRQLKPVTPQDTRAFLVEAFNRILISKVSFDDQLIQATFRRGIEVFEEKSDLLPFEEAKLYGHNSTHAVAAYLGAVLGVERIADLKGVSGVSAFLENAFIKESGGALIRRHKGADELFTLEGYQHYVTDLLARMFNPHLGDTVGRVGRDPRRKLEWDDRLVGTVRLALREGINPARYALGTAAALAALDPSLLHPSASIRCLLDSIWHKVSPDPAERQAASHAIEEGHQLLCRWRSQGYPNLENFMQASLRVQSPIY
jgi:mannitol-1-phosphate 5-dehydrogenase